MRDCNKPFFIQSAQGTFETMRRNSQEQNEVYDMLIIYVTTSLGSVEKLNKIYALNIILTIF